MPLTHCSLIGIDETTPLVELAVVSDMYPYAEWGFLYAPRSPGAPGRYPSVGRIRRALKELPPYVRIALHVGDVAVAQLLSGEPTVSELVDQRGARGGRVQLSFDAAQVPVDLDRLRQFVLERTGLTFIVPLVGGNRKVIWTLAGVVNHAILLDGASLPGKWPPADEPVPCGYAGGLGPENLSQQLPRIYDAAGSAEFWIAMDGRLRDEHDRFSMTLARKCLEIVSAEASGRLEFPAPRPLRRRCEPLHLIDAGLMRSDEAREFETMLRLLLRATRDVADPAVLEVRQMAESLLQRKGTMSMLRDEAASYRPAAARAPAG